MTTHSKQGQVLPRAKPADMRDYRFWFNRDLQKWCVAPAAGSETQVVMLDALQLCELDVQMHPNGTMTCMAEFLVDGATFRFDQTLHAGTARSGTLRLLRIYDQLVHVPVMKIKGAAKAPGS